MNERRVHNINGVNWFLLVTIMMQFAFTFVYMVIYSFLYYGKPSESVNLIINQITAIFLPVVAYAISKNVDVKKFFRFKRLPAKSVVQLMGLGFCGQFIGQFLNIIIILVMTLFKLPVSRELPIPEDGAGLIFTVFAIALMPGIFEELLIRGVVLRAYEKKGARNAIIVTAVLFSIMHFDLTNMLAPFFSGMLFAYVVLKTDSLFSSIILHVTNNITGVMIYILVRKIDNSIITGIGLSVMIVISLIAFLPLLAAFRRGFPKRRIDKGGPGGEIAKLLINLPVILIMITFIIVQAYNFGLFKM